jgi:hypothetical protein
MVVGGVPEEKETLTLIPVELLVLAEDAVVHTLDDSKDLYRRIFVVVEHQAHRLLGHEVGVDKLSKIFVLPGMPIRIRMNCKNDVPTWNTGACIGRSVNGPE